MIPGARPPSLPELVRAQDRLTFIYLERCAIHRDANAITATDERGTIHQVQVGQGPMPTPVPDAAQLVADRGVRPPLLPA